MLGHGCPKTSPKSSARDVWMVMLIIAMMSHSARPHRMAGADGGFSLHAVVGKGAAPDPLLKEFLGMVVSVNVRPSLSLRLWLFDVFIVLVNCGLPPSK